MSQRARGSVWPVIALGALLVAVLTGIEILEDGLSVMAVGMALLESLFLVGPLVAIALIYRQVRRDRHAHVSLTEELAKARADGAAWRAATQDLLGGLGRAIDEQFKTWGLTTAEGEVALLILKGLGFSEIASVRGTSERTVKQQARAVYAKAGLTGRSALSAYFLEDLLLPVDQRD